MEQGYPSTWGILAPSLEGGQVRRRTRDYLRDFALYASEELDRSPKTVATYVKVIRIAERFSGKPAHQLTSDDLREFKRSPYSQSTKGLVITAMRSFHQWGAMEGHWKLNGLMAVKANRVFSEARAPLSIHSARTLLTACRVPNDFRLVYLGLYAGCRISESASMTSENWRGDRLKFVGKGRKPREVPVHPELERVRHVILSTNPASESVLDGVAKRLRLRTGVRDVDGNHLTSHTLRRSFSDLLYNRNGVPWEVVGKLLGHGEDVTARYARISFDKMQEAVHSIDWFGGDPVQLRLF